MSTDERFYVAWFTAGGGIASIRLAVLEDGGRSLATISKISASGILDASHPGLQLSESGELLLVFQSRGPDQSEGWGPTRPYLVRIAGNGTATELLAVPGSGASVSHPVVTCGG